MRMLSLFWLAGVVLVALPAQAEKRTFIIANNAHGYGIDRCLATGASCGTAVAAAYCRAREFDDVLTFRRIERSEITGAVPASSMNACQGASCDTFVAITCSR